MARHAVLVFLLFGSVPSLQAAQAAQASPERRVYETRRAPAPPTIDGQLDDAAWQGVEWAGDFVQREPDEGRPPSHQTRFKVVYDDQAVYFAFRALQSPGELRRLLARRDTFPGDWVEVNIDSYLDRRTAFSFTLSLSGTRGDELISNDGDRWDGNWDPVWEGATHADGEGWTAEMRIPLSQLRFSGAPRQTWGLQVQRRLFAREERSTWQAIPKATSGWVSRFGELRGIEGVRPGRRLEVLPYTVAKVETYASEDGNPFRDGRGSQLGGGLDGKYAVSSNLTLDFTLNPDFGQVEADPSVVNLTAFETFYEEKRPFFIEGSNILDLRLAPAITGGHFTQDRLFYSRRIGAPPPLSAEAGTGEFSDEPPVTSILGAFKLSGKTPGGLSIGVLDGLTSRETAQIAGPLGRRREPVAPFANSFVGRLQQDLRGGDTQLGLMLTAVDRDLGDGALAALPGHAYAGGIDFLHRFGKRAWILEGNLLGSHVRGRKEAIDALQTASARYFQRPDNEQATYDPSRTSLGGHAGSLRLTRTAERSDFRLQTGLAWRSPGFEINDLGYMRRADEFNHFTWAAYQRRNPVGPFNRLQVNANEWLDWDFSGRLLRRAANTNASATFRNNWQLGGSLTREWERLSNTDLRGGPSSLWPGSWSPEVWVTSDTRRRVWVNAGTWWSRGDEKSARQRETWLGLTWRPANALTLTLNPTLARNRSEMQYVDTVSRGGEARSLFGRLDQKTSALTVRADLALTPNLTVQIYGAPFVSTGRYADLKRITSPRADAYRDRFRTFSAEEISLAAAADEYRVDEDRDGAVDYAFARPDFDYREFNSTLVLRWEYRPGSLLYVVWSQARLDEALRGGMPSFGRGLGQTFDVHPHDVFLVKLSKWVSFR